MLTIQEIQAGLLQHGEEKGGVLLSRFAQVRSALYRAEKRLIKAEVALKAARAALGPVEAKYKVAFKAFTGQAEDSISEEII